MRRSFSGALANEIAAWFAVYATWGEVEMLQKRLIAVMVASSALILGVSGAASAATVHPLTVDRESCSITPNVAIETSSAEDCFGAGSGSVGLYGVSSINVPTDMCVTYTYNGKTASDTAIYIIFDPTVTVTYLNVSKCIPV